MKQNARPSEVDVGGVLEVSRKEGRKCQGMVHGEGGMSEGGPGKIDLSDRKHWGKQKKMFLWGGTIMRERDLLICTGSFQRKVAIHPLVGRGDEHIVTVAGNKFFIHRERSS